MLIVCPSCATSYDVEAANLQPEGRQVRCVRCRTVWRAEPQRAAGPIAPADASVVPDPGVLMSAQAEDPAAAAAVPAEAAAEAEWIDPSPQIQPDSPPSAALDEVVSGGEVPDAPATADPPKPDDGVEVEAPPIAPADYHVGPAPIELDAQHPAAIDAGSPAADVETAAARRKRREAKRRRQIWSLSRLQTIILILLIVDSILLGWRKDVVSLLPQTAPLYSAIGLPVNLRGLSFDRLMTSTETQDGVAVLVVQGDIINDTEKTLGVPRLKFLVRNAAKQEIYSWSTAPPLPRLSPHQAVGFRSRLVSPLAQASDVVVRFFTLRDRIAEMR